MAKKKKEKKGGKRMKKRELVELMVSYFQLHAEQTFGLKQLFRGLKLTTHPLKMLCVDILNEMIEDGFLVEPARATERTRSRPMKAAPLSSSPNATRRTP